MPIDIKNEIEKKIEADYKKHFNVRVIPNNIKNLIKKASNDANQNLLKQDINKKALVYGKTFLREIDHKAAIDARLKSAYDGVRLVTTSSKLKDILKENAEMLYAKMQALKNAGFTDDQSFQLIIAEVSGKKAN